MKRLFLLAGAIFFAAAGIFVSKKLPAQTDDLIEKKYDQWTGVIRVWAADDAAAEGWLNSCAAITEKEYDGVYINIQTVSPSVISQCCDSGINPPDIIIYGNTVSSLPSFLTPVTAAYPLRSGLMQNSYSVPVLLRPRFWIYDAAAYDALPGDMADVSAACTEGDLIALAALCSGLRPSESSGATLPGIDIGLTGGTQATPAPAGTAACRAPEDILTDASPRMRFLAGDADAFIGGTGDLLICAEKTDAAAAATGDYAYASDVIMCSIINKNDSRAEICRAYLDTLMTEGQTLAAQAQAFPAIEGVSAWSGEYMLASVEAAYEGKIWLAGAYDTGPVYQYIEGKITADEAIRRIVGGK